MAFDVSKLPRQALLDEAFPGQEVTTSDRFTRLSCTHPGHHHAHNDDPAQGGMKSLDVNGSTGAWECKATGESGSGWKAFVCAWWSEARWRQLCRDHDPAGKGSRKQPTMGERWAQLEPETEWTRALHIHRDLSERYLRAGTRYPGDPRSPNAIALRDADGKLVGIKWRLAKGATWQVGSLKGKDGKEAKYGLTKGSSVSHVFLGDLLSSREAARVVVCAGEKDALVAASHLDAREWGPVSSSYGEGSRKIPEGLRELCAGRRVVLCYDGDPAGRAGAVKVARYLDGTASEVLAARMPEDTPPGGTKPGWDVADVVQHRGGQALVELLEAAVPVPAEWAKGAPPGGEPPSGDGGGQRERSTRLVSDYDNWDDYQGCTVIWKPHGKDELRAHVVLRALIGVERVCRTWTEDPESETGWSLSHRIHWRFDLQGGDVVRVETGVAKTELARELERPDLAAAVESTSRDTASRLHRWGHHRTEGQREETTERRALGDHGALGWLAPGGVTVRDGRVERSECLIGPPTVGEEFRRFRLSRLADGELREVASWITETMLTCDHVGGAYTLPLLGAFVSAPLWSVLRELDSWQRSLFFVQGTSGVGKSQVCRYFWSFWGDFTSPQGLTTWISSATYLEQLLHHAVCTPVFVADYKQGQFSRDTRRAAMALMQAYADRSARGRAGRGGSTSERKRPPRCAWIVDGEDLPEGEQSTIGRMVILELDQHGGGLACEANESALAPAMVAKLPAVTARWIAWCQRHHEKLLGALQMACGELLEDLPRGSSNRDRLVRAYAVQLTAVWGFLTFMVEELGVPRERAAELQAVSREAHQHMAARQLARVTGESAGEVFWRGLLSLLESHQVFLRPPDRDRDMKNPFGTIGGTPPCVGTYDYEKAYVWPTVAEPLVQQAQTRGGGDRIQFSRAAVEQQLTEMGMIANARERARQVVDGRVRRLPVWEISLASLGRGGLEDTLYANAGAEDEAGA